MNFLRVDFDLGGVTLETAELLGASLNATFSFPTVGPQGPAGSSATAVDWSAVTNKPSTFTPSAHAHAISDVTNLQTSLDGKQASGTYATLESGKVPASQLPSYVDDILEYANVAAIQSVSGESGKIYVALDTNKIYRWSGSAYVEVSPSAGAPSASINTPTDVGGTTSAVGTSDQYARADHRHAFVVAHTHAASDISDSTSAGRNLLLAANAQAQRDALDIFVSVANFAALPTTGVTVSQGGSVYVTSDNGKVYVWNGTAYSEIAGTNNYPAFTAVSSAHLTTAQEITYGSAPLNRGSAFSFSSGRFTAPAAGVYSFLFTGMTHVTSAPAWTTVQFRVNSAILSPALRTTTSQYQVNLAPGFPAYTSMSLAANIQLNANDYVSVWLDTGGLAVGAIFTGSLVG
jgi:hypothetical protein